MADGQGCRIDEGDAAARSQACIKIKGQNSQNFFLELPEPSVADEVWKLRGPVDTDLFLIKVLQRSIVALMEGNKDRHYLAGV